MTSAEPAIGGIAFGCTKEAALIAAKPVTDRHLSERSAHQLGSLIRLAARHEGRPRISTEPGRPAASTRPLDQQTLCAPFGI